MKVQIYQDEMYPVNYICETEWQSIPFVEIPDELYERYKKTQEEFENIQDELDEFVA